MDSGLSFRLGANIVDREFAQKVPKMSVQDEKKPPAINLDTILVEEIGQFGRYQMLILFLASFPIMFAAVAGGEYIFSTGRLPTRCLIPECDGANPEFEPAWLGNAVPGSPGNYDECSRFVNVSAAVPPAAAADTCPAELFNRDQTISCDEYVYERTNTVVYDFGLECDEWRRTLIGSIRTVGILLALPLTGLLSDRWGRRVALSITAFNTAWIGILRAFANSYELFTALMFLEAMLGGGAFVTSYIIVTEYVGPKYRVIAGPLVSSFVALGFVINGLLAWAVQDWRYFTLTIFVPQLITLSYFWLIPESVRWLMTKGRYTEAETILKRAASFNNRELSESTLEALRLSSVTEKSENIEVVVNETPMIVQVWRSRVILSRCCVTPIWWISAILVYYGISINAVSLAGNRFLNYIYVSAIEIPGYWTAMLVLDRVGRKPTLIVGFIVCSACQFGFAFISDDYPTSRLILYLLGKYFISLVTTSLYIYTVELYPTKFRQSLFAFSSMIGRIGSIIAPLTPALMMYWEGIPSVIFGSSTLVAGLLVFTTPETLNAKLPDTIEEAENLGKKRTSNPDPERPKN